MLLWGHFVTTTYSIYFYKSAQNFDFLKPLGPKFREEILPSK
jgi:hypothetical protein